MVSTHQKAPASPSSAPTTTDVVPPAEPPVLGCRPCPAAMAVPAGSRELLWELYRGEELLRSVTELQEEVSRLRSIREREGQTDCWNRTLPSLGPDPQADGPHDTEDSPSSLRPAKHSDLRDGGNGDRLLPGAAGASPP